MAYPLVFITHALNYKILVHFLIMSLYGVYPLHFLKNQSLSLSEKNILLIWSPHYDRVRVADTTYYVRSSPLDAQKDIVVRM